VLSVEADRLNTQIIQVRDFPTMFTLARQVDKRLATRPLKVIEWQQFDWSESNTPIAGCYANSDPEPRQPRVAASETT